MNEEAVIRLLMTSSCFGRETCTNTPCACARSLIDAIAPGHADMHMLAALVRLMEQPTMNPLAMTVDQRKELWAAHEQARAAIAKARGQP